MKGAEREALEPMWCPFCGKPLDDQMGDPSCATCHIVWTVDIDGYKEMHVGSKPGLGSRYRGPLRQPFHRVPRASDEQLRVVAEMVLPLFIANNWQYGVLRNTGHIPTVDEIANTLKWLQEPSFEGQDRIDSIMGRFRVRASADTNRIEIYLLLDEPTPAGHPYLRPLITDAAEVHGDGDVAEQCPAAIEVPHSPPATQQQLFAAPAVVERG